MNNEPSFQNSNTGMNFEQSDPFAIFSRDDLIAMCNDITVHKLIEKPTLPPLTPLCETESSKCMEEERSEKTITNNNVEQKLDDEIMAE
jgi:hypothetical protein